MRASEVQAFEAESVVVQGLETARLNKGQMKAEKADMVYREYIGTLLEGKAGVTKIPVMYNVENDTYYEGPSSTIINDKRLVFGLWNDVTAGGASKISNLRKFYANKYPYRLQKLRLDLLRPNVPNPEDLPLGQLGIRVRGDQNETVSMDPSDPGLFQGFEYDQDTLEFSSAGEVDFRVEKADLDAESDDVCTRVHTKLEHCLGELGFQLRQVPANRHCRVYCMKLNMSALYNQATNMMEGAARIGYRLRQAAEKTGWIMEALSFPIVAAGNVTWYMVDPTGVLTAKISMRESTLTFDYVKPVVVENSTSK